MTTHPFQIQLDGISTGIIGGNGGSGSGTTVTAEIEIQQIPYGGNSGSDGLGEGQNIGIDVLGAPRSDIEITSLGGLPGANGENAYQVATDNGFVGSVTDWLDSLKAPFTGVAWFWGQGEPDGKVIPGSKPGDQYTDTLTGNVYKLGD